MLAPHFGLLGISSLATIVSAFLMFETDGKIARFFQLLTLVSIASLLFSITYTLYLWPDRFEQIDVYVSLLFALVLAIVGLVLIIASYRYRPLKRDKWTRIDTPFLVRVLGFFFATLGLVAALVTAFPQ